MRVYNEHPTYPLHDAPLFCAALLDYLTTHALWLGTSPAAEMAATLQKPQARATAHVDLALQAMLTLLTSTHNFNVEEQVLLDDAQPSMAFHWPSTALSMAFHWPPVAFH